MLERKNIEILRVDITDTILEHYEKHIWFDDVFVIILCE